MEERQIRLILNYRYPVQSEKRWGFRQGSQKIAQTRTQSSANELLNQLFRPCAI